MQNCGAKQPLWFSLLALLTLVSIFREAPIALAQIGGPKDLKREAPDSYSQQFEKEGIVIDFSIKAIAGADGKKQELAAGADAVVGFSIKDKKTGQPITGLHPNGWFSARTGPRTPIAESPDGKYRKAVGSAVVEPEFKGGRFKSGEPVSLKFRITDPVTKQAITGIKDIEVLIFEPPGIWQKRLWAKEAGDGLYEITQAFPRAGSYNVMIRSASRGLSFSDVPPTKVAVN